MDKEISNDFFNFDSAWFEDVTDSLFEGVKESYNKNVVKAVKEISEKHMGESIKLANFIRPELQTVLGRQRRDYGLCLEYEAQFPIEQQASNIDGTPVHNLGMERLCGLVDYR